MSENTNQFQITEECALILLDGIQWKHTEGDMASSEWQTIYNFLQYIKERYPRLAQEKSWLFER